ncbi:hypothetical protein B0H11DRAFT_2034909 [Mycena galericulata]|nr:hypothetical protein B0H11DRAFT_2034909 [Mycena galericulata]
MSNHLTLDADPLTVGEDGFPSLPPWQHSWPTSTVRRVLCQFVNRVKKHFKQLTEHPALWIRQLAGSEVTEWEMVCPTEIESPTKLRALYLRLLALEDPASPDYDVLTSPDRSRQLHLQQSLLPGQEHTLVTPMDALTVTTTEDGCPVLPAWQSRASAADVKRVLCEYVNHMNGASTSGRAPQDMDSPAGGLGNSEMGDDLSGGNPRRLGVAGALFPPPGVGGPSDTGLRCR